MATTDDTTVDPAAEAESAPTPRRRRASSAVAAPPEVSAPAEDRPAAKKTAKKATKKAAKKPAGDEPPATKKAKAPKAAKKATAKPAPAEPVEVDEIDEIDEIEETDETLTVPSFSLLFQAPDLAAAPSRRRATRAASAPAGEPAPAVVEDATDGEVADAEGDTAEHADDQGEGGRGRRRRRGGRGRRPRGSESGETTDEQPTPADEVAPAEDTERAGTDEPAEDEESGSASSRRRRRRRRSGTGSAEQADPPGTTTRVRQSRARDEVTGVRGSTRLEAKKQRRREGREAGRRRTIITEAEFLARRESVDRTMVVRGRDDRTQIAVLEDNVLVEHYVSRETTASMAGNVYLGRVQNVLPSMEAAFVDIGRGRNAVLYAGEVNWDAAGLEGNMPKRIENALSSGDTVLVQVTKDPIGHKGARLTSQISLPGRFLVLVPEGSMTGISRKLPDTERARLKAILKEIVPDHAGVIVRTAAEGASEEELRADVERLTQTWDRITAKAEAARAKKSGSGGAPVLLHGEPDLTVRVIRDIFNEDFGKLVVAGERATREVEAYVTDVAPDLLPRLERWTGEQDVFHAHRIDEQLAKAMDRKVWLPSGGSLVIDRTEAMTVVDVNTGKFVGSGGNLEETVTKNNIEAAEEIVRQLRLRDLGGIIVIDFIDMVLESNRDLVVRRLLECLGRDRTKHQVAEVTSLGLVQMTRKRVGSGLVEIFSEPCEHCHGRGLIIHDEPVDKSGDSVSNGGQASNGNGNGSGAGSGTSATRSTSRRGRSSASVATRPAVPEPVTPSGPTAAQIAAAAHAAAVKVSHPDDESGQNVAELEPAESQPVAASGLEAPAYEEPAVETSEPAAPADEEPPATVVARPRRKRGRVVAPAGPPTHEEPTALAADPAPDAH